MSTSVRLHGPLQLSPPSLVVMFGPLHLVILLIYIAAATSQSQGNSGVARPAVSLSDIELESGDEEAEHDTSPEGQHLFPSFTSLFPPLGHRPSFYPEPARGFQLNTFRSGLYSGGTGRSEDPEGGGGMLGSGNFGVIRGGTYYAGSADEPIYVRGNNAHSRPYRRPNPPPMYRGGGDFFQSFRDFADITTPSKAAYSQYVVVYANRKANPSELLGAPRNIIEQLELIEAEDKKSKTKKKLEAFKEKERSVELRKKSKKSPKEQLEPLLALS